MPKSILVVEDSADDVFLLKRAFKANGVLTPISHVEDGHKAVDYLSGKGAYGDRTSFPIPCVILLDIKMPFFSGFEVLRWIREESGVGKLPVVMLTSSNQECDVEKAYALGANAYLVKPNQMEDLTELATLIKGFWIDANIPPPSGAENDSVHTATSRIGQSHEPA